MPDAQFPQLSSELASTLESDGESQKGEKGSGGDVFALSPRQCSYPKYFIKTLKYFMDEDLKLGLARSDRRREKISSRNFACISMKKTKRNARSTNNGMAG